MKQNRNAARNLWLFALGVLVLWLLEIPQLSLFTPYRLFVVAALSLIAVQLRLRHSLWVALLFVAVTALFGWFMELSETAMLPIDVAAQVAMLLVIDKCGGNLYLRILLGCLLSALILALGMAGLMYWRKESGLMASIAYGLTHQWRIALSGLVGALMGGYLYARGRPAE